MGPSYAKARACARPVTARQHIIFMLAKHFEEMSFFRGKFFFFIAFPALPCQYA